MMVLGHFYESVVAGPLDKLVSNELLLIIYSNSDPCRNFLCILSENYCDDKFMTMNFL